MSVILVTPDRVEQVAWENPGVPMVDDGKHRTITISGLTYVARLAGNALAEQHIAGAKAAAGVGGGL